MGTENKLTFIINNTIFYEQETKNTGNRPK